MTPQHAKIMSQPNNTPWVSISFHEFRGYIANRQGHYQYLGETHRSWGVNNRKAHVHWEALGCMSAKHQKSSVQIIFPSLREAQRSASAHAAMAEARHTTPPLLPAMCASNADKVDFTVPCPSSRLGLSGHATLVVVPSYNHGWKMTHIDRSLKFVRDHQETIFHWTMIVCGRTPWSL